MNTACRINNRIAMEGRKPNVKYFLVLISRGVQIQTDSNKNCKSIQKNQKIQNQILLDVLRCHFKKIIRFGSNFKFIFKKIETKPNCVYLYLFTIYLFFITIICYVTLLLNNTYSF